jgi:N-hydroxyarylamine O-acetyltransferase
MQYDALASSNQFSVMDLHSYFKRIGYTGHPGVDLETLTTIHHQHLLSIPYENLDVQLGRAMDLDLSRIYTKLVDQRRGGWCYEMNGLLEWALSDIGFDVMRMNAGVMRADRGDEAMGNHLVLCVQLEQPWLADTGLGDGPVRPYPLVEHAGEAEGFSYRVEHCEFWRVHNYPGSNVSSFDFYYQPADEALFERKCQWLSTDPESPFVTNLVCQIAVPGGFDMQIGRLAKTQSPDGSEERLLNSADELVESLLQRFHLDVPEIATRWDDICERHESFMASRSRE